MKKTVRFFWGITFSFYLLALVFILFLSRVRFGVFSDVKLFSREHFYMINPVPFSTIWNYIQRLREASINTDIVVRNIAANLLLFAPMGFFMPIFFRKKYNTFWKTILFIFLLILAVEILQFLTFCGSADIDDLILNSLGAMGGYGIFAISKRLKMIK